MQPTTIVHGTTTEQMELWLSFHVKANNHKINTLVKNGYTYHDAGYSMQGNIVFRFTIDLIYHDRIGGFNPHHITCRCELTVERLDQEVKLYAS